MNEHLIVLRLLNGDWVGWCGIRHCVMRLEESPQGSRPTPAGYEKYRGEYEDWIGTKNLGLKNQPDLFLLQKKDGRWSIPLWAPEPLRQHAVSENWENKGLVTFTEPVFWD